MLKKRTKKNNSANTSSFSVWTSYTDLMANAFMILTLLLLLILASKPIICPTCPPPPPPNIEFGDAQGYTFDIGRATLGTKLQDYISYGYDNEKPKLLTQIAINLENYPQGDIIEVIGHTDTQTVKPETVNACYRNIETSLDRKAIKAIENSQGLKLDGVCYMSNFDLGYMRALAVAKEIEIKIAQQTTKPLDEKRITEVTKEIKATRDQIKNLEQQQNNNKSQTLEYLQNKLDDLQKEQKILKTEKLESLKFRAYSAGPMISPKFDPKDKETDKQDKRRRIEIRFTESQSYSS